MLKRYQVLLENWQADYISGVANRNDLSFSEAVRIFLCEGMVCIISNLHPEYKPNINKKKLGSMAGRATDSTTSQVEKHDFTSKLYFEARKAVEYRSSKIEKKK